MVFELRWFITGFKYSPSFICQELWKENRVLCAFNMILLFISRQQYLTLKVPFLQPCISLFCSTAQVLAGSLWPVVPCVRFGYAVHTLGLSFFFCDADIYCTASESCDENLRAVKVLAFMSLNSVLFTTYCIFRWLIWVSIKYTIRQKRWRAWTS